MGWLLADIVRSPITCGVLGLHRRGVLLVMTCIVFILLILSIRWSLYCNSLTINIITLNSFSYCIHHPGLELTD